MVRKGRGRVQRGTTTQCEVHTDSKPPGFLSITSFSATSCVGSATGEAGRALGPSASHPVAAVGGGQT